MFRPTGDARARANRIAAILEAAGHRVSMRPVRRTPVALYRVIRDSPEVVHSCGSGSWRAGSLAARLTGAAVVFDALAATDGSEATHRRLVRDGSQGRRGGAVLAEEEGRAREIRSALGLDYLPPVVGASSSGGDGAAVLTAVYQRLPHMSPKLPSLGRSRLRDRAALGGARRETVRRAGFSRPLALAAYLRGRWLLSRGRRAEATLALGRARRGDRRRVIYGLHLVRALREAGSFEDAGRELTLLAGQIGEGDEWGLAEMGEVGLEFARLGMQEDARAIIRKLELIGEQGSELSAEAWARAALVWVACGQLGTGRDLASRAAAVATPGSPAEATAALAMERCGELSRALELAGESGVSGQALRLTGALRQLSPGWAPTVRAIPGADRATGRGVLYLLEASMPQVPSGYAYRSRDVLAALSAAGLDPTAATRLGFPASRGIADFSPVEIVSGVVHHRFNFPGLRQYSGIPPDRLAEANAECLLELVERARPRLVLAGTPNLNGAVARALRSAADIPFVYDVRGFPEMTWGARPGGTESELYRLRRDAETGCAAAADAVFTVSETMKAELASRGLDPGKLAVVPHVVDTHRYSPRPRNEALARSYGIEGSFVVGSISSLTDYEGLDDLLRAVAQARAESEAAALIVGDGPARAPLQALAADLGIEDAVVFTGRIAQDRVPEHYALLDVFALPRRDLEVCRAVTPLKPFEAMAMGVPVIASDLPALAEPLAASGGGLLVEPGSHQALAAAILELNGDRVARGTLSSNARDHVLAHHSPARATEAIRSVLGPLMR